MSKFKRVLSLGASVLLSVGLLASCSSSDKPSGDSSTAEQTTTVTETSTTSVSVSETESDTMTTSNVESEITKSQSSLTATQSPVITKRTTTTTKVRTTTRTEPAFDYSKEPQNYSYTSSQRTYPYWKENIMRNESMVFVKNGDTIKGSLMFQPYKIISVRDWTLEKEYKENVDWVWDEKTRTIRLTPNSSIPYFTENQLAGNEGHNGDCGATGKLGGALYCVGPYLYTKQISVSYIYNSEQYSVPHAAYQGDLLPKTMAKLKAKEKVQIAVFGDSIMYGCDASSMYNRKPQLPNFATLVRLSLQSNFGSTVTVKNPSVGGKTSDWGVEAASQVTANGYKPDLVLISFGQNDSLLTPEKTKDNIVAIMNQIKKASPNTEFMVLSTINANEKAGFQHHQQEQAKVLASLKKQGVAYVDINSLHTFMLKKKDHYVDLSGNNINHPNDFMIRAYVMDVMSALVKY